jgi:hypothetical protein
MVFLKIARHYRGEGLLFLYLVSKNPMGLYKFRSHKFAKVLDHNNGTQGRLHDKSMPSKEPCIS